MLTKDNHEAVSRPAGSIQPERPLHHHRHTAQKGRRREGGGRSNPQPQGLLAFPEPAPRRVAVHRDGHHHGLGRSVPAWNRASVAPRSICTFNTWPRPRKGLLPAGPRPPTRPATWSSSGPISWMPDKTPSPPARPPFGLSEWNWFETDKKGFRRIFPNGRCRFRRLGNRSPPWSLVANNLGGSARFPTLIVGAPSVMVPPTDNSSY